MELETICVSDLMDTNPPMWMKIGEWLRPPSPQSWGNRTVDVAYFLTNLSDLHQSVKFALRPLPDLGRKQGGSSFPPLAGGLRGGSCVTGLPGIALGRLLLAGTASGQIATPN